MAPRPSASRLVRTPAFAAALAVVSVVGCGRIEAARPPAQQTALGNAAARADGAAAFPSAPGPVPAGRYVVAAFDPPLLVELPEGFESPDAPRADAFGFGRPGPGGWYVGFVRVETVFTDFFVRDPVGRNASGRTAPAPEDLVAWLQANPYLELAPPLEVEVAGRPAVRLDAAVGPLPAERTEGVCSSLPVRCVTLIKTRDRLGYVALVERAAYRLVVLPLEGADLLVAAKADDRESLERAGPEIDRVLASVALDR